MNNKHETGFGAVAIIIACFVVVVLGATGFVVFRHNKTGTKAATTPTSQTQQQHTTTDNTPIHTQVDPYEGWKTYTNSKYGFSFRYPANWQVEERDPATTSLDSQNVQLALRLVDPNVTNRDVADFTIRTKDFETVVKIADGSLTEHGVTAQHSKTAETVSGQSAYKYVIPQTAEADRVWYFIEVENKTYDVETLNEEAAIKQSPSYTDDFDKFVQSLQLP